MTKILNGAQLINNYIIQLKNSSIYKTKFGNIISQFSEEIEYFLSQFPFFKLLNSKIKRKKIMNILKYVKYHLIMKKNWNRRNRNQTKRSGITRFWGRRR